ncbi:hypothetical protein K7X08_017290 [Anisodus acutangulus]|uniref:RING-type domain-containing protein n=1 Tax=Anisodus acutangulus TaxID=402998 RepID=A0A9Q1LTT8_9SOLA|nr:hypothetical protein K7X08_017290 [Anisodus acutangulus]
MKPGNGQAIFTAECSHLFHFSCIANNIKHGNYLCPICICKWKEIPLMASFSTDANINNVGQTRVSPLEDNYLDNIPRVPPPVSLPLPEPLHFSNDEPLPSITMDQTSSPSTVHPESGTLLTDDARQRERAPIDLVTVLDISGSMAGSKLTLLKMTEQGRREAAQTVNAISANGGTNIVEGLKKGVRVLEERHERNPVASIILLLDGRNTNNGDNAY